MTKEVSYTKDSVKLKLYGSNESECNFLMKLLDDLNIHGAVVGRDMGNFHYGLIIDVKKDE